MKTCNKCGRKCANNKRICTNCGSRRFWPPFVIEKKQINRNFSVQITKPKPLKGTRLKKRLTLYKWWPGDHDKINVNTQEQWEKIIRLVNEDLAPLLGWRSKKDVLKVIKESKKDVREAAKEFKTLFEENPQFIIKLLKSIRFSELKDTDHKQVLEILTELGNVFANADEGFKVAYKQVVAKLPTQKKAALDELSELLEDMTLRQITALTNEIRNRIQTLENFKERVLDDKTYEISGDRSIHRLLEKAMWIVDERYLLLHSNEILRKIIGKELEKKDNKYKKKRPDFVCGTVENALIIVELKRPSHILTIDDLDQLETYIYISEKYSGVKFTSYRGILVGRKIHDELRSRLKYRGRGFQIMTYSDLIDSTEKRYKDFLKILKSEQ